MGLWCSDGAPLFRNCSCRRVLASAFACRPVWIMVWAGACIVDRGHCCGSPATGWPHRGRPRRPAAGFGPGVAPGRAPVGDRRDGHPSDLRNSDRLLRSAHRGDADKAGSDCPTAGDPGTATGAAVGGPAAQPDPPADSRRQPQSRWVARRAGFAPAPSTPCQLAECDRSAGPGAIADRDANRVGVVGRRADLPMSGRAISRRRGRGRRGGRPGRRVPGRCLAAGE